LTFFFALPLEEEVDEEEEDEEQEEDEHDEEVDAAADDFSILAPFLYDSLR